MRSPVSPTPEAPRARRTRRTPALIAAVLSAGLLLAACGTDDAAKAPHHGGTSSAATPTATPSTTATPASRTGTSSGTAAPGPFNDADVMFAQMMIPHHRQALEMAGLADGRAEDPEIKKLVAAIERAQDPEIRKMRDWLREWGEPESAPMDHGSGHGMSGMMTEQQMKRLAAAKGKAFDRLFAQLMIAHHDGAVEMARQERRDGRNATAKRLADDVVRTQSAEVAELRRILGRL
ncbi:DUF305 domain-containing protein [Streptomyces sp.]|uniref:DUF305 domain-containing protein n=1 Tax=Streptomyces sp. TaxID=1931 RepID=UPI0028128608|nr:DUF305 domain-containing protein [Streptomyces sp.]